MRWPCLLVKNCPCQGLRCVVAMLASELLRLPAFKLSRLSCEVVMFVKYRSCQGLSCEVAMFVCNICHRLRCVVVYFWNAALATGLSFWNIGPAPLRDLLNTPRSPAAMLRQCEMDWSCHMLLYSVPQQHCRRGCGGSALPTQKLSGEKMQDHMVVRPWRPHGMFFISQERRNISRDENLHVLWS